MVIDIRSKTVESFRSSFYKKVVPCRKYYGMERIKYWGKNVGSLKENTFWITKVGTPLLFFPCRYFYGCVELSGEEAFIRGEFHINKAYLAFTAMWFFLVAGKIVFIDIGLSMLPVKVQVLVSVCIFLLFFLYILLMMGIDTLASKPSEKEIISILESL